ncbi:GTP-binding protein [Geothrix limicola]|uniref:GTP-binding protein n=1 Tax=Geothrix limicola TaxID=2927978 RepID=A0ABQ5QI26_9BACT|nr:GxxExxY protein [Geothrix limicola]GLH74500.1 GTP-binding protein [Geothrix limicola]
MTRMGANDGLVFGEEAYAIVGAAMEVHSALGSGFLEAVYADALAIEFSARGIPFKREAAIAISYKGQRLSHDYRADFIAYESIIVELKAIKKLGDIERAQATHYLKATTHPLAILLNFGAPKLDWTRIVLS